MMPRVSQMGKSQIIHTDGEDLVVITLSDYEALRARAGDEASEDDTALSSSVWSKLLALATDAIHYSDEAPSAALRGRQTESAARFAIRSIWRSVGKCAPTIPQPGSFAILKTLAATFNITEIGRLSQL
jgi:hypothetical protein